MVTVTFDSVELMNPSPVRKTVVGSLGLEVTFTCLTDDYTDISSLLAKSGHTSKTVLLSGKTSVQSTGTVGTLSIGSDSYTKCSINGPVQVEEVSPVWWRYTVSFVQDTT